MASIVFEGVTKRYPDGTEAVTSLDLTVDDGELAILVGPSGCGKSTALRMVAGLEEVSDGRILLDGDDVTKRSPSDRDIAMVFQNYALYPHMTVEQNMSFALKLKKRPKQETAARVTDAAATLGLQALLERKPANLSGGQRQRVAMGRAIVREPKAFLMDEPLSNLDAKLRVQTRMEIARLQRRLSSTMLYVTHDQVEAMTLGDRVITMRAGRLQQAGPPKRAVRAAGQRLRRRLHRLAGDEPRRRDDRRRRGRAAVRARAAHARAPRRARRARRRAADRGRAAARLRRGRERRAPRSSPPRSRCSKRSAPSRSRRCRSRPTARCRRRASTSWPAPPRRSTRR